MHGIAVVARSRALLHNIVSGLNGEDSMKRFVSGLVAAVAISFGFASAPATAETVKVGLILPYSGEFAALGTIMDNAIKLWVKQNGENVGAHKVELIRRDETGPNPDVSRRLAQELITRDGVK